ncbi:hypothetical protein BDV30DRAFT_239062 [Aspergillus minisclerotigenes]|uniref:Uncharacterized protein n=1 Tax=Aspergillus minisclerotigenes TaxID=656917 RepID=A0A5N6J2T6_9EURO|nr:hypothetical protein BDV30DRAFT_239062 [Aspergillus minisclerotigenes]
MDTIEVKNVEPENPVLVRFQIPLPGQDTHAARVTQETWNTTQTDVQRTFMDYYNTGKTNAPLWLRLNLIALSYAGLSPSNHLRSVAPQPGLDADNVAVSFILPSGVKRIQQLTCEKQSNWHPNDKEAADLVVGINGTLQPGDLAYTTMQHLKQRTRESRKEGTYKILIDAERADGSKVQIRLERV